VARDRVLDMLALLQKACPAKSQAEVACGMLITFKLFIKASFISYMNSRDS
jgi:hypothetical protein